MGKIILASASPRRAEILKKMKYEYRVIPSPYQENNTRTDFSYAFIEDLAYQKAAAVVPLTEEPSLVIGADTMVVLDGKILGKPRNPGHAFEMLRKLSGRTHSVVTAIALINTAAGEVRKNSTTSRVTFENLTDEQINYYIETFNPFDKAGSYGIQELPEGYIKSYEGSLENIIGMCSKALLELLMD
jgi:septum formation protein